MKKTVYGITFVNLAFQMVYMILGKYTTTELGVLNNIFYIFRPEYMVVSGVIAFINLILFCIYFSIKKESRKLVIDVMIAILNTQYIAYYINFISMQ